ncbi:MAG: type II toxin-antitoxin system RelE/ParE family toxin [Alphaproteobacteria bacterium]|nr:MAG: type II toxin-antitoxin system RelE/ParE family toxin [Alphaproteobacteria bacterium]
MPYSQAMKIIRTKEFDRRAEKLLDEDDLAELQDTLLALPDAGDVIPASGGLRKLRWALPGRGKRGGARVIYFVLGGNGTIYLLTVYAKAEKEDLDPSEKKAWSRYATLIKEEYRHADEETRH